MAGVSRHSFAPDIKIVRLMCTGRVDLSFILRAFSNGAEGVFIGGCWPGECHYITEGNYDALANVLLTRKILAHLGLDPKRLRLEWIAASEGSRYAEVMDEFIAELKALGPLGQAEGVSPAQLAEGFAAVTRLVPYLKLVERERFRLPIKDERAYREFFASDEFDRLFDELVAAKLAVSRIVQLLAGGPSTTKEISERLGIEPAVVSRHMNLSSRQGLVRYDVEQQRYALA